MTITFRHEIYFMNGSGEDRELIHNIFTLTKSIHTKTVNIMADLTTLTQEVAETRTVMASAVTLIQGLKQRLDEAGTDPVKLQELSSSLDQGANELAAAVAANTPAQPGTGEEAGTGGPGGTGEQPSL